MSARPPLTLQMPAPPDPVAVTLDAATTALLVFDVVEPICARQPVCRAQMLPAIVALLGRARTAGVTVGYATRAHTMSDWLPEVSPAPGETSGSRTTARTGSTTRTSTRR